MTPQATGGASRNESSEKTTIPAIEPRMSRRYASSGGKRTNVRATRFPIVAITATVKRNTTASSTQRGSADHPNAPNKRPSWSRTDTGKSKTKPTSAASATGAHANSSGPRDARKNPIPIPRKLASKTKFVRYARWMSLAAVHRMSANSTNSMRKLSANRRSGRACRPLTSLLLGTTA